MSGEPTNQPAVDPSKTDATVDPAPILADPNPPVDAKADDKPVDKPVAVVPEKYEFKAPEGVELDRAQLDVYEPIFKELGLTQEQAQKLIDTQIELAPKLREAQEKLIQEQMLAESKAWADAAKADKEYGGAQFDENMKIARQGLAAFGSPALKTALVESGFANHPEFVRLFWNIGRRLSEDTPPSDTAAPHAKANGGLLYPSMQS